MLKYILCFGSQMELHEKKGSLTVLGDRAMEGFGSSLLLFKSELCHTGAVQHSKLLNPLGLTLSSVKRE